MPLAKDTVLPNAVLSATFSEFNTSPQRLQDIGMWSMENC
jgi:hypothetical protein